MDKPLEATVAPRPLAPGRTAPSLRERYRLGPLASPFHLAHAPPPHTLLTGTPCPVGRVRVRAAHSWPPLFGVLHNGHAARPGLYTDVRVAVVEGYEILQDLSPGEAHAVRLNPVGDVVELIVALLAAGCQQPVSIRELRRYSLIPGLAALRLALRSSGRGSGARTLMPSVVSSNVAPRA